MRPKKAQKWKSDRSPLFRGDSADGVRPPDADPSIVRHILYIGGAGRETPYVSTSEDEQIAEKFAGGHGAVWSTLVPRAKREGVTHRSLSELRHLLKGHGHGDASGTRPYQVQQARRLAEQWREHLLDFRPLAADPANVEQSILKMFTRSS